MADRLSPDERSALMSRIRGKNTKPELLVRSAMHRLGYRYKLHARDLPGRPDLVFPGRKKVIFVHGCFWHSHPGCRRAFRPSSRSEFWQAKLLRNRERDQRNVDELQKRGWDALIIWECDLRDQRQAIDRATSFLGPVGVNK